MKRICLVAAAAVLGMGSGPAWAEGQSIPCPMHWEQVPPAPDPAVWYVGQEVCPTESATVPGPKSTEEASVFRRKSRTVVRAPKTPVTPVNKTKMPLKSEKAKPAKAKWSLANAASAGWGAFGLGLGVIVAGVGVLILVNRK